MTDRPSRICAYCGGEFTPKQSHQRFCRHVCRSDAWHKDNPVARKARQLRYWHKADGGYIKRRRRELAEQRADVLQQLMEVRALD